MRARLREILRGTGVYVVLAAMIALLPGGSQGSIAGYALGGVAALMVANDWSRYWSLRAWEVGPFLGSARANHLLVALFFLPVSLAALLLPALPEGQRGNRIGDGITAGVVLSWLVIIPVLVTSGRRFMKARKREK